VLEEEDDGAWPAAEGDDSEPTPFHPPASLEAPRAAAIVVTGANQHRSSASGERTDSPAGRIQLPAAAAAAFSGAGPGALAPGTAAAATVRKAIGSGAIAEAAAAAAGAGVAGALAGVAGGVLLTIAPGSAASLAVIPVLAAIGAACGAIGGAGVGSGLSIAAAIIPARPSLAAVVGGAAGGGLVGLVVSWLGLWSLTVLVGMNQAIGGGLEGVILGGAAGLGYRMATGEPGGGRPGPRDPGPARAAGVTAGACALGALGLALSGRPLVGGTIHLIAQASTAGQAMLTPLGRMIGEPGFGPLTAALIAMGEGATFGLGLSFGLARRR
jgi:hypothetical protein